EKMLRESWENAERDFAKRQLVEAINQANSLIRATEKSFENPLLEKDFVRQQRERIDPVMRALREDIKHGSATVIGLRTRELDLLTQNLAETIMQKALKASFESEPIDRAASDV